VRTLPNLPVCASSAFLPKGTDEGAHALEELDKFELKANQHLEFKYHSKPELEKVMLDLHEVPPRDIIDSKGTLVRSPSKQEFLTGTWKSFRKTDGKCIKKGFKVDGAYCVVSIGRAREGGDAGIRIFLQNTEDTSEHTLLLPGKLMILHQIPEAPEGQPGVGSPEWEEYARDILPRLTIQGGTLEMNKPIVLKNKLPKNFSLAIPKNTKPPPSPPPFDPRIIPRKTFSPVNTRKPMKNVAPEPVRIRKNRTTTLPDKNKIVEFFDLSNAF